MIGVIYARYSSDNQREESIEGQLRECRSLHGNRIGSTTQIVRSNSNFFYRGRYGHIG